MKEYDFDLNVLSSEQRNFLEKVRKGQITKNQHYVHQGYLKNFENDIGKIEKLDIVNKRISKSGVSKKSTCSERYFYALETGKEDEISQVLESFFGAYETSFNKSYDELEDAILRNKEISKKILKTLCEFVVITRMRGKHFREDLKRINENFIRLQLESMAEYEPIMKEELKEFIKEGKYDILENNLSHISFLSDEKNIKLFSFLLSKKKVRIHIANGKRNFVTSDNCILRIEPHNKMYLGGVDFLNSTHYFVLNPKILIEFLPPNSKGKHIKRNNKISDERVTFYNFIRSGYSNFLYSNSKDNFIEEEYNISRSNYIDELADIFGGSFIKERNFINSINNTSKDNYTSLIEEENRNINEIIRLERILGKQ